MGGVLGPLLKEGASDLAKWVASSAMRVVERETPAGAMGSAALRGVKEEGEKLAASMASDSVKNMKGLPTQARDEIFNYLRHGVRSTSQPIQQIAEGEEAKLAQVHKSYIQSGLVKKANVVPPHMWLPEVHEPNWHTSQKFPNPNDPLTVLPNFYKKAVTKAAEAKAFGPKDQALVAALKQVSQQAGSKRAESFAERVWSEYLHRPIAHRNVYGLATAPAESAASQIEAAGKLSLAVLSHTGQVMNIGFVTGLKPFVCGFAKTAFDYGDAKEFAFKSSAILNQSLRELKADAIRESAGGGLAGAAKLAKSEGPGVTVLRYSGFYAADKFRRTLAANASRFYADEIMSKLAANAGDAPALRQAKVLGIDVQAALSKGLSDSDYASAARRLTDITQFERSPESMPRIMFDNPWVRSATMFQRYFFQQSKFVKDFILKPAFEHGEFRPLIYAALTMPVFGEMTADIRHFARYGDLKDRPDWSKYPVDRILDNVAQFGAMGIMYDVARAMSSSDKSMAAHFLLGPALSDVADVGNWTFNTAGRMVRGEPVHPLHDVEKQALSRVPMAGPILGHKAFPPKKPYKDIFQQGTFTKGIKRLFD